MIDRPLTLSLTVVLLACPLVAGKGADRVTVPADGAVYSARLAAIDADWNVTLDVAGLPRIVSASDLVRWGARAEAERGTLVLMVDGGVLVANEIEIDQGRLVIWTDLWGEVRLPLRAIRGLVFHPPADSLQRDLLVDRVARSVGTEDQLWLDNGDRVSGLIRQLQDDVQFDTSAGRAAVAFEKITAIVFNPSLASMSKPRRPHALIGFFDGTCLTVERVVANRQAAIVSLPAGVTLESQPDAHLLDQIALVQPLGGRVTYLSDLKPAGYKHAAYLARTWTYGIDRNVLGGRLRGGGTLFAKGLGMHSAARLSYRLDGAYRRLDAELAIDDQTGHRGSVTCRVFIDDGSGKWKPVYQSPIIRGSDAPLPLSVDLTGARQVSLIVDFADRGDELDHANWLGARLIR